MRIVAPLVRAIACAARGRRGRRRHRLHFEGGVRRGDGRSTDVAVLDFDDVAAGTVIPSGGPLGGVTFDLHDRRRRVARRDRRLRNDLRTNSLGLTGDLMFLAGDAFFIDFQPATAIGLYVIGEDMLPGDIELRRSRAAS